MSGRKSRGPNPKSMHLELPDDLREHIRRISAAESSTMVQTVATILRRAITVQLALTRDDAHLIEEALAHWASDEGRVSDATMEQIERITDVLQRAFRDEAAQ